ncbi:hypothetical protein RCH12_002365 [Cryobacterium sp. MP_3.1]|uniref:Integral membrane protein n=1 Tax=Cryobacterium zongtaii TaxID=1259217 RepID=A0A2S3ZNE3_9MICO|nr:MULTISPECIES: hypothetical protein [Cryobacterium]MEC5184894.1 hypothetical protein [Cryobacterium sp. MP_3.1]POH70504.1 hypothetical protein C3B59_04405 [Cryobacterium zongtaii]
MDGSSNLAKPARSNGLADPAAEIARLSAENARLRGQLGPAAEHRASARWRAFFAALLITIGVLLAPVSVVAYWTKGYINDTDRFVASLAPLADDPAVQAYLVDEIVAVVNENVDINTITSDLFTGLESLDLPQAAKDALALLETPAAQGVQQLIESAATNIVASDAFAELWEQALRTSQTQVIAALEGDTSTALVISDTGELGIQLGPIIAEVKKELVDRGFSLATNIPEVDRTIVVAQSDSLVQARTGYQLLNVLGFVLPLVSLGLIVLGVLVARRRSRTMIWAGLTLALAMAVLAAGIAVGRILFVSALSPTYLPNNVAQALYDAVVPFINTTALSVGLVGFTVAVVAYLAGPFRGSTIVRRATIGTCARIRAAAANAGVTTGGFGDFLYHYRRLAHVLIGLAAAAVAIFWRPLAVPVIIWTAVLALIAVLLVELLQRPPVTPGVPPVPGTKPGTPSGPQEPTAAAGTESVNPTLPLPPADPDDLRGQTGPTEPLEPLRTPARPE